MICKINFKTNNFKQIQDWNIISIGQKTLKCPLEEHLRDSVLQKTVSSPPIIQNYKHWPLFKALIDKYIHKIMIIIIWQRRMNNRYKN